MVEAKLIRAVREALKYGEPNLTLNEVYAYTTVVASAADIEEALGILCHRNQAFKTLVNGQPVYRRTITLHSLPAASATPVAGGPSQRGSHTQRVRDYMRAQGKPASTSQIRQAVDMEVWQLQNVLRSLEARGEIATVGERRKGKPCHWVCTKKTQAATQESAPIKTPVPEDKPAMNTPARVEPTPPNAEEIETERRVNHRRYSYRSDGTLLMELPVYGQIELDRDEADTLFLYLNGVHQGIAKALEVAHE